MMSYFARISSSSIVISSLFVFAPHYNDVVIDLQYAVGEPAPLHDRITFKLGTKDFDQFNNS